MKNSNSVDPPAFVVRAARGAAMARALDRLRELGEIDELPGSADRVLLRPRRSSGDAREDWRAIRRRLDPDYEVEPVLVDDRGGVSYPTGQVTVRFARDPTEDDLARICSRFGLTGTQRNRYVPSQVTFDVAAGQNRFLPDLVRNIEADDAQVQAAWLQTVARFERE